MESHIHQKLLLITVFSILVFNYEHAKFVQHVAAHTNSSPEPATFPSQGEESPDQELPGLGHVSFPPSEAFSLPDSDSFPPSESDEPSSEPFSLPDSDSLPPSESDEPSSEPFSLPDSDSLPPSESDETTEAYVPSYFGGDSPLPSSAYVDSDIKKICDSTDYPSLCLSTIVPSLDGQTDVFSVLEIAIKASHGYASTAFSMVKKLALTPGMPNQLVAIINDCRDSYDDVLYNFQRAMTALPARDVGTMNTMLSAVLTDVGDCQDAINAAKIPCPLSVFGDKLTNMTSNCLAIASMIQ
ncbi:unnamed protein product [Coffea canephora]|uniref:Pectinesterase inhibitor domain-containing protein n=1 Tax=Coffea canephora TaxID=49390 RepID=A0A068TTV9_COFCA|nr:unnamed protein product [Coffea canephora]